MKSCVGIAGCDQVPAVYALAHHLKELGNFDEVFVEFVEFKRAGLIYLYQREHMSQPLDQKTFTMMFVYRENWNGSLLNIHMPTVYEAVSHEQLFPSQGEDVVYDITMKPWKSDTRYYSWSNHNLVPMGQK